MPIIEKVLADTPDYTLVEETDAAIRYRGLRIDAKPGSRLANAADLRAKASSALDVNATFLALAAPNNAQTLAQVQRLTRETSALIRLFLDRLDDTAGT